MDYIKLGVCSDHKLIHEGICCLLERTEGFEVYTQETSICRIIKNTNLNRVNIFIIHTPNLEKEFIIILKDLLAAYPKLQVLILTTEEKEENILKAIKSGAKGILAKDSDKSDLIEAIYTLRGGHDYHSKSITQILLKKYISNLKSKDSSLNNNPIDSLSNRELEILKLWGDSCTNYEISEKLYISIRTVESHKNHIMQKLNMKTAVDLVKFAIRNNIIEI